MTKKQKPTDEFQFFRDLGGEFLVEEIRQYEAIYIAENARAKHAPYQWQIFGAVQTYTPHDRGVRLQFATTHLDITWLSDNTLQVWSVPSGDFNQMASFGLQSVPPQPTAMQQYRLIEADGTLEMHSASHICRIDLTSGALQLYDHEQRLVCEHEKHGGHRSDVQGAVALDLRLQFDEDIYGLGERAQGLNRRGGRYTLWNTDQPDCDRGKDPLYYNVPFYIGVHTNGVYGVFVDNSARGVVDVGHTVTSRLSFEFESGEMRYYLMAGADVSTVLQAYSTLTGTPPLPPLWFLGYQQSRFSYFPQSDVLKIAEKLREERIPTDVIYLDIHYMDAFKVFTWDTARFPNFTGMIGELHKRGFKVVPIIDPGVKIADGYSVYESGLTKDVFIKLPHSTQPISAAVWPGMCHFPDFSRAAVRRWWSTHAKSLIDTGIDGIWNDMNEPAVFATKTAVSLPDTAEHGDPPQSHREMHNVYAHHMSEASQLALTTHRPNKRVVNITRAGFAGTQRYASTWTGDVTASWDHLQMMIPMIANMGLSGAPLIGSDIGGFRGDTTPELLTRWTQAGSLMPYFRNHAAIDTINQEPWVFGEPYTSIIRSAIELRYRLMPYLYATVAQACTTGVPVVRPLFMADISDAKLREIEDQFMVGDVLMVAPIVEAGATQREVTLPSGEWYEFYTGRHIIGGKQIQANAPLDILPLYVRAGSVLPLWELAQHLSGKPPHKITMRVYAGEGTTQLYEDEGEGFAYQTGNARWLDFNLEWVNNRLKVQKQVRGKYEPTYTQVRLEIIGFDEEPLSVRVNRQGAPVWYYEDGLVELTVSDFELLEVTRNIGPTDETIINRPW